MVRVHQLVNRKRTECRRDNHRRQEPAEYNIGARNLKQNFPRVSSLRAQSDQVILAELFERIGITQKRYGEARHPVHRGNFNSPADGFLEGTCLTTSWPTQRTNQLNLVFYLVGHAHILPAASAYHITIPMVTNCSYLSCPVLIR
jgi:hypothetical protein